MIPKTRVEPGHILLGHFDSSLKLKKFSVDSYFFSDESFTNDFRDDGFGAGERRYFT